MPDAIVIGAGASGLMAARELGKAGKSVLVLEARDRIGGRIFPLDPKKFGYEAEGGAEFVHGSAPLTSELAEVAKANLTNPHEWWTINDGEPARLDWDDQDDTDLIERLKSLKEDMAVTEFFDRYLPDPKYAELRGETERRLAGYDAADPERASAFALRDELLGEGGELQRTIVEGYGPLLRELEKECRENGVEIRLGMPIIAIDATDENVIAEAGDRSYESKCVIITVPPAVLESMKFVPAIPEKIDAAKQIGFGNVIKVLLRFDARWWAGAPDKNFDKLFFMMSEEKIPTWWTQYPRTDPVLTGWLAGPKTAALAQHSKEELLEIALQSLSSIFKLCKSDLHNQLIAHEIIDWGKEEYSRGAYSYYTPQSDAAIKVLSQPIENKIYFAGEALYQGEQVGGTVEAALQSGQHAARMILESGAHE